jgi:hypothetical protein
MKKPIYIVCKKCEKRISKILIVKEVTFEKLRLESTELTPLLRNQHYCFDKEQNVFISINDKFNLKYHTDTNRFQGCCGNSIEGLPNIICNYCSSEIGREVTDCCTPHYVKLNQQAVVFSENFTDYILRFEKMKLPITRQIELEVLLAFNQIETVDALLEI